MILYFKCSFLFGGARIFFFSFLGECGGFFISGTEHPREDKPDLYYCAEITEQKPKPLVMATYSRCWEIYSRNSKHYPRGRCLTSITEVCGWCTKPIPYLYTVLDFTLHEINHNCFWKYKEEFLSGYLTLHKIFCLPKILQIQHSKSSFWSHFNYDSALFSFIVRFIIAIISNMPTQLVTKYEFLIQY